MGLGRLREAEDRYREAIRIDERASDRRGREQGLAFSYYGLGVALDRDQREVAAREATGRAVAMDPNGSLLRLAQQPGADFSFIPDGEVYYYIGVASELAGKTDDALAAFQEYVARQPKSRWMARARAHIAALAPVRGTRGRSDPAGHPSDHPPASAGLPSGLPPGRHRWRAVAFATAVAQGPIAAPVIDAALKRSPPPWGDCFADVAPARGHDTVRFVVELELDAHGAVARATAKLPAPFDAGSIGQCVEVALQAGLVVTAPAHAKPTSARVEVLLANGDAGGL